MLYNCQWHVDGTAADTKEIFVFGSNTAGYHIGGAAKEAAENYGAIDGISIGYSGNSYAIATLDSAFKQVPIGLIKMQVINLFDNAKDNGARFFITRIGCGIAGFKDSEIAPLFKEFIWLLNVSLPQTWKEFLI